MMARGGTARKGRPEVFLCNMGGLRDYKARADFSRGFFATGRLRGRFPGGIQNAGGCGESICQIEGRRIAVICSTDENYPALVPALVKAIRTTNPKSVIVLAGYPQDQIEAHKQTGSG